MNSGRLMYVVPWRSVNPPLRCANLREQAPFSSENSVAGTRSTPPSCGFFYIFCTLRTILDPALGFSVLHKDPSELSRIFALPRFAGRGVVLLGDHCTKQSSINACPFVLDDVSPRLSLAAVRNPAPAPSPVPGTPEAQGRK